ncbi:MAG: hypothetical protein ACKN9E_14310, partial [Microcystaceae cyanobacterium]
MTTNALHIEGNLISADLLPDMMTGEIKGQQAQDFGFKANDKLEDEIAFVWSEAKSRWAIFQGRLARLAEEDSATSLTREYWAMPLLELLGYQPSYQGKAEVIDNQTFAVSHRAGKLVSPRPQGEGLGEGDTPPIHVIGCRLSLEKRPPSGTPRLSAHGLVQEFLNRTEHLWGITTNGYQWRLLRDCSLMTRLAYIEFDLEQIFNNENFAESRRHRRCRTTAHTDTHAGATELDQQAAHRQCFFFSVKTRDITQTTGNHDRLVITIDRAAHILLVTAEVTAQVGAAEFIVECRPADRTIDHDLQRRGDAIRFASDGRHARVLALRGWQI